MKEKLITFETAKLAKKKGFRYVTQGGTVGQIMRKVGGLVMKLKNLYIKCMLLNHYYKSG